MKFADAARLGIGATRVRLTGKRIPLAAMWALTNRCDALCSYCATPFRAQAELSTSQALDLLESLTQMGCQQISFTGGEPLLRDDLPTLLQTAGQLGIRTHLETNGHRLPDQIHTLLSVDHILIAIEGEEAIHNTLREPNSYSKAIAGIEASLRHDIETSITSVLTSTNLGELDAILALAERYGIGLTVRLPGNHPTFERAPPLKSEASPAEIRHALQFLIAARREGRPVAISEKTLHTLLEWDDYEQLTSPDPHRDQHCLAGVGHVYIDVDGRLYPCREMVGRTPGVSLLDYSLSTSLERLNCESCQACATADLVERNHALNLNPSTLWSWVADHGWPWARLRSPSEVPADSDSSG